MPVGHDQFYAACPGVVLSRSIDAALQALPDNSGAAAILAAVLPLLPEGNPYLYTAGAPSYSGALQPGATPVLAAALPAYPVGLKPFADSNPDPFDGWSVELDEDDTPGGPF